MFNPTRPYLLYASFRRLEPIYCWDLRGDVTRPVEVLTTLSPMGPISGKVRKTSTNQRLRFDIDYSGKWLAVGDEVRLLSLVTELHTRGTDMASTRAHVREQDGGISVFDLAAQTGTIAGENVPNTDSTQRNMPIMQYDGHHGTWPRPLNHPVSCD